MSAFPFSLLANSRMKSTAFLSRPEGAMSLMASRVDAKLRRQLTLATCALVLLIGLADFRLGTDLSMQVFYFLPVALAVIARGAKFGIGVSLACVAIWVGGDFAAGAHFSSLMVPVWNAAIVLIVYLVLVWLLSSLLQLQIGLERRVEQRTAALASEIAGRERLEKSILEISERERRSIGHDLHDGLSQHLTGTAITGQLLADRLQDRAAEETADARKVVGLVKTAIDQTRRMAKGLLLADIDAEGLSAALFEFCATTTEQFRIHCTFINQEPTVPLPPGDGMASHLFRITQEAVRNAIRHGGAKHVEVRLQARGRRLNLSIQDDGSGLPPPSQRGEGLGLQIMAHRAKMIGATIAIERAPAGGTMVQCTLPLSSHE
jgi:signal transduction histidine kinase